MVDIMIPWMIYIISFLTGLCTGQIMVLNNVTACYTNLDEFLELNCTVSQQIEVHELYFVTKNLNSSECKPPIANASFFDGCCSYSNDDCVVDVFTTSGKEDNYNYIFQSCTGRNGCKEKVGWIANHGACNTSIYSSLSTYMLARYECISDDLIIANSSDVELTNEVIYLQNGEDTSQIACSVESTCDTTVVITAIDVNLTCDAGTINCNHNNDYRIKEIFESSDHFLQLEINVTEGHRFWIQLKANDSVSKLTVSCGAKKRNTAQNSCVESTTEITPETVTSNVTLDTSNVTVTETSNVTTPETPVASNVTTPATSNVTTPEPATSNVTTLETVISNLTTPATSNVTSSVTFNVTASEAATSSITTPATPTVTTPVTTNITASETATSSITTPATSTVATPTVATPVTSDVTTPETTTSNITTSGILTPNVTTPQPANQESTLPNTSEPDERTILIVVLVISVLVIICIISLVVWFHIKQRKSIYKLPPIEMKWNGV